MSERIKQLVASAPPYFTGSEGQLHRLKVGPSKNGAAGPETLWFKRWSHSRRKAPEITNFSPYWHRVMALENVLIKALFPEHTVQVVDAYDERGRPGPNFEFNAGRPVTVTKEVNGGDHQVLATREDVMRKAFAALLQHRNGGVTPIDDFEGAWRRTFDARMVEILGPEISFGGPLQSKDEIPDRINYIRAISPDSVMADYLEAGIIPVHPESNFIPGSKGAYLQPPHGTFLAFEIYDLEKLWACAGAKFANDPAKLDRFYQYLDYYQYYVGLDKAFDDVMAMYLSHTNGNVDKTSFNKILLVFETLLFLFEKGDSDLADPRLFEVLLIPIIQRSATHEILVQEIDTHVMEPLNRALRARP